MSDALGVAVVGLGVGEAHARVVSALSKECRLRWLVDHDRKRAARLSAELGGSPGSLGEALADPQTGLVVVASYDHDHAGQVVQCFGAGKHVFVEKPLCRTRAELAAIQGAWRPDLHMSANLVLRAAPLYRELGVRVRQGGLGQVYALDGEYLYGRLHKITEGWRAMVPEYSVLQGGGIHMLDLLVDLAGERPNAVTATGNRISTQGSAFQGPADFAVATFEFPSGQVGRLVANFGSVLPHQHALRVYGTTGTFLYDDAGARLHTSRDPEAVLTSLTASPFPSSKGALVPELIGAIQGGADPLPAFRREVTLMSACLAADDALRTRERVEIHYESVD